MKKILININQEYFFQYFATIAGSFSILSSGINLGWTSPFLPELLSTNSTIPTTNDEGSWCAIAPLLGAPPGAILAAVLVDRIGRKKTTLLMAPWVSLCFIGIAFSRTIWEITGLRFIIGSVEGALYTVLPMYVGEISDPKIRDFLTATIAIAAITGTLFINIIGSFLDIFVSSLICAVIPLIHMVAFTLVPESPYYYTKKGNFEAAKESLQILRGKLDVDQEMDSIAKAVVRQERTNDQAGLLDLFTISSNRRACFIFIIVCMTNKFSGKNPCMFYTEMIFKESGSSIDATLSVIVYCSVELVAVAITTFFVIKRFGKRMLLITSSAGCSISVLALSVFFFLKDFNINTEYAFWLPITALVSYNIMFSIGLSFGMVTVLGELFPTNVKAKALCIADTFSVLMGALVSKIFQISVDKAGSMSYPFLFFSICSFIGFILILKYMPETKGKTLEEIQQLLIGQQQYSSELRVRELAFVSATDPDCGVNAVVNYTVGDGFEKLKEFQVRSDTGEICISSSLDYETRNVYEFPVIATDREGLITNAMVKIQVTDVNDNRPIFYPPEYNVSLRDGGASSSATTPVLVVSATDADSGKFGSVSYRIVAGNDGGLFRIDRSTGEIFVNRPHQLSTRNQPYHRLNISATDGGNLKSLRDAEVFISIIDSTQRPPIFDQSRYVFAVMENAKKDFVVGHVKAAVDNNGRSNVRYSIYSGDPEGLFRIDPITGEIRTSGNLDHESRASVLLNVQATSGNPPVYGHTQVNIDINDVNDNTPEFESSTVRISIPENTETGVPLYAAHATDKDSGANGVVRYKLVNTGSDLFKIDPKLGHLTLTRQLDYESIQRHTLVVTATDMGTPALSANLTILVEVQDINDNPPVFEKTQYSLSVPESLQINTQITQFTAVDADTGNNARITYRLLESNYSRDSYDQVFGIFPNSGWLYLKGNLDRETKDHYNLIVAAKDNGLPPQTATSQVMIEVLDINDNDPVFNEENYVFKIEENLSRGTFVGSVQATDADSGANAAVRYSLIPGNSSFQINAANGEITAKDILDRETREIYDLVAEAKDQGHPSRSARVAVKIYVLDVNDNAPEIVDPQEDVVSVREEQTPGTEVVRIRAIDADNGYNSSITYSLLKDSDGLDTFSIHPITGIIRTKVVLDHEEKTIYRIGVVATDGGNPPKQSVRILRVEVLDLNDNRPTFTSSSLTFTVKEDAKIGQIIGTVASAAPQGMENLVPDSAGSHITYTLTTLSTDLNGAFEIERNTGKIVVAQELDREKYFEYKLEVRALDIRTMNNPQSSAITVKIEVIDINDNAPEWAKDPVTIHVSENTAIGTSIYKFFATDLDSGVNGEIRYTLNSQYPNSSFSIDSLTGALSLTTALDYEKTKEHLLVIRASDQPLIASERLSSYVTARIIVTDFNDNTPRFILPPGHVAFLSQSTTVGMKITNILAVDDDSGDNGRVTYILSNSNDATHFSLGYDTGILTLAKPLTQNRKSYLLNITATDHGKPTRHANMNLKLLLQDSSSSFQKLLELEYEASVMENAGIGTVITQIQVKGFTDSGGNLTFFIPPGIADDTFEVHSPSGKIYTRKPLDRETLEYYSLPIYVTDFSSPDTSMFDKTTLNIKVMDINDHAPKFQSTSCQRLTIPENSDTATFHTVVAHDLDSGTNSQLTYSITSGNIRNKFSIDSKTGELTAKPLDRESNARYYLTITAQDHGTPSMQGYCNLTVLVEDQNDNDPKFDFSKYSTTMLEDVPIDTSIMKVHASDADTGLNAKIIYFLANESQWLFRIDNKTGVITTAGLFDRERKAEYNFMVVVTDSGRYNARSTKVPVTVYVKDVNDNKPIFTKYPFQEKVPAYVQPGQNILKVTAKDIDEGTNAEIVYNLVNEGNYGKFRINPNTGMLSATQSLASSNGKVIYLNVVATDKGNPPKSSTGLIELVIGDLPQASLNLRFQNITYEVTVPENVEPFRDIVQVSAVRTDGRRQKILYTFGTGNEENIFVIGAESGVIQVRDPKNLDYEIHHSIHLVVEGKTEGSPNLHGYCDVIIRITDENDNAPKFTQQQYTASVWEGDKKGTFVLQVVASDADEGQNSRILYHIVDGNHDNAFKIEPAFSGIVRTNTVLDREIRDNYRLTIIATDEGIPQMTGTARVRVNVVDVNDNQPTFPPPRTIRVSEDTAAGSLLTTLTANDVDTFPELTYSFTKTIDKEYLDYFSIDRFSGKIFLRKRLDFEMWQECRLKIIASDTAHEAETVLTIEIVDVNDNYPVFQQSSYEADLPDSPSSTLIDVITINATDEDSGKNSKVTYSIINPIQGFTIGSSDGIIKVNMSNISKTLQDIYLTVKAEDSGEPALHSLVAVRIKNTKRMETTYGYKKEYRLTVPENTKTGSAIIHLAKPSGQTHASNFVILEGNIDKLFEISNPSGALTVVKSLDRELQDEYDLTISIDGSNSLVTHVVISVEDFNDNAPVFSDNNYEKTISESLPVGTSVEKIIATDADQAGTPNADIHFDITSGNADGCFLIDFLTGIIRVNNSLDYDKGSTEYHLVIRACDNGLIPLCTLTSLKIILQDENDNVPVFPFSEYMESVGENEPVGTVVFTAHATDLDKGIFGKVNYSFVESFGGQENSWKMFHIDPESGLITTAVTFDYEQRSRYNFVIKATDSGGKASTVKVYIEIEGKDEFYPQFTERTYKFPLATSVALPVGYVVGHVIATDKDKGPDGRVVYQLTTQHSYFKINRTTGAVLLKKKFDNSDSFTSGREISLVVTASSGKQGSLTNMTVIEIILDPLADPGTNIVGSQGTMPAPQGGISDWALGLVISITLLLIVFGAVFVYLHMRNKRNRKMNKPNLSAETVSTSNNYVDPSAFDTIPCRGGNPQVPVQNQFAPPKYDEIPPYGGGHAASSNSGAATTSELSGSEQSGSSGRGSAEDGEDGEDEEIRMINEGPLQRNSDGDSLSAVSVRNTQEYLARLGIVDNSGAHPQAVSRLDPRAGSSKESLHHHQTVPLESLRIFDEESSNHNDITNLIYAKLNDVANSDRASSTDEGAGGVSTTALNATVEHVMALGYGEVPTVTHQPSMNGSLSSIVHSEEELAGSYNWDYLLDWGPQYQPLAHVFSEIARLKDDTASVHSGASGNSSVRSKVSVAPVKNIPPPLITSVAPRAIAMPILNPRAGQSHHNQMMMLPRSPINHDASGAGFSTSTAMSPSFSPSLSPLATKSPSISPLVAPGLPTAHHVMSRQNAQNRNKSVVDTELRI